MAGEALFNHTFAFYEELEKRAKENEHGVLVFEGHTTKLFHYLGISTSWRSRIIRNLQECDNITIIQRGTAHQPSVVVLKGAPDEEEFYKNDLTGVRHLATLMARLEERVEALEGWRETFFGLNTKDSLLNHERRISQLELKQERENAKAAQVSNRSTNR